MLEKKTNNARLSQPSEKQILANIYRKKLINCGLSIQEASKLMASHSLEQIKKITAQQKRKQSSSSEKRSSVSERLDSSKATFRDTARVWSARPSSKQPKLSCSRKRTKVERAIKSSRCIAREHDPLRHLGYIDEDEHSLSSLMETVDTALKGNRDH